MTEKQKCPDRIFLQACDECYDEAYQNIEEVRWSTSDQRHECSADYDKDEEYVRLSCLKEALDEIENEWINGHIPEEDMTGNFDDAWQSCAGKCSDILRKYFPELKEMDMREKQRELGMFSSSEVMGLSEGLAQLAKDSLEKGS